MALHGQEGLPEHERHPSDPGDHKCRYDGGAIPGILDPALFQWKHQNDRSDQREYHPGPVDLSKSAGTSRRCFAVFGEFPEEQSSDQSTTGNATRRNVSAKEDFGREIELRWADFR